MIHTLADLEVKYTASIPIHCDNTSAISVSKNPIFHSNTKHRGSFILIEYLIPPKFTATTQGEHVFFDIDVKGGEKGVVWTRCYSWRSK
jgi:hypothetical protein